MKIFYDTEFVDDGRTIDLISIGMVAENGRELYRVSAEIDEGTALYQKITTNDWLMRNVVPHLPLRRPPSRLSGSGGWYFSLDMSSLFVVDRRQLRNEVRTFIEETPDPELWAWYSAYDHVALAQLFGRMMSKPEKMPMWTNDIRQLQQAIGVTDDELEVAVPPNLRLHNALDDAKWNLAAYEWLTEQER